MAAASEVRNPDEAAGTGPANAAAEAPPAPPAGDEAARARAYLDLWERHLVHAALHLRAHPEAGARAR